MPSEYYFLDRQSMSPRLISLKSLIIPQIWSSAHRWTPRLEISSLLLSPLSKNGIDGNVDFVVCDFNDWPIYCVVGCLCGEKVYGGKWLRPVLTEVSVYNEHSVYIEHSVHNNQIVAKNIISKAIWSLYCENYLIKLSISYRNPYSVRSFGNFKRKTNLLSTLMTYWIKYQRQVSPIHCHFKSSVVFGMPLEP